MPPKPKPLSQQEEEDALFDAPLFPDSANENADADKSLEGVDPDDPALFDAPLFPKDVYDPERSPSPPAWEPKDWWDEILGKANEVVSTDEGRAGGWRAALQGASLNTADNLTRWASPSFADSLDAAAKEYPGAHGVGQAFPRTAAAMLGGPSVVSQGMAQSGVSGLASAFDGGSFKDVLGDMGLGALEGSVGTLIGKGVGTVGRAVGDTAAGRWAGRQLGRFLPAADDAAHVVPDAAPLKDPFVGRRGELARMLPEPVPPLPPEGAPFDPFAGRRGALASTPPEPMGPLAHTAGEADPFVGRRGEFARMPIEPGVPAGPPAPPDPFVGRRGELARMPSGPPPLQAPYPPAPSAPPSASPPYPGPDEQALIDLLWRRKPSAPYPRAPSAPPAPSPPYPGPDEPGLTDLLATGAAPRPVRGPGGRFVPKPVERPLLAPNQTLGEPPLPIEPPGPPLPLSPGERLARMDLPEPPARPTSLSEPPLPVPPEPPPPPLDLASEPSPRAPRAWMEPPPDVPLETEAIPPPRRPSWMEPPPSAPLETGPVPPAARPSWSEAPPPQPLDLAFEPGPPRTPRMETAPYDVPLREGASSAGTAEPGVFSDLIDVASIQTPRGALRGAAAGARLGKRALNALGGPTDASGLATAGRVATGVGWDTGLPGMFDQKVNAQDYAQERPAVADLPTLHYALQATLASGRAGLSPEDEQALTEAVVQGDQVAISATDFRLRQRYPAYARRVERELRAYNEEN